MTKTVCDICGKDMPTPKFVDTYENLNFCISSHGKIWDICSECRVSLNRWMTIRRKRSEIEESEESFNNLCSSCSNIGCEFQSGIVRTKCAFYIPPRIEPDNCGNYVIMHQQS